jgi:hypothetical protein
MARWDESMSGSRTPLHPALRPAFRVGRGVRHSCEAMHSYARSIRRGAPCDLRPVHVPPKFED